MCASWNSGGRLAAPDMIGEAPALSEPLPPPLITDVDDEDVVRVRELLGDACRNDGGAAEVEAAMLSVMVLVLLNRQVPLKPAEGCAGGGSSWSAP